MKGTVGERTHEHTKAQSPDSRSLTLMINPTLGPKGLNVSLTLGHDITMRTRGTHSQKHPEPGPLLQVHDNAAHTRKAPSCWPMPQHPSRPPQASHMQLACRLPALLTTKHNHQICNTAVVAFAEKVQHAVPVLQPTALQTCLTELCCVPITATLAAVKAPTTTYSCATAS